MPRFIIAKNYLNNVLKNVTQSDTMTSIVALIRRSVV